MERCINCDYRDTTDYYIRDWNAVCASCGKLTWIAPNQIKTVRVIKLTNFGIIVDVGDGTKGLIHISELSDSRIDHPSEVVEEGDVVTAIVLRVDMDEQKIGLSIKRVSEAS